MLYDGLPGELPTIRPTAGCKDIYLLGSRVSKQLLKVLLTRSPCIITLITRPPGQWSQPLNNAATFVTELAE